MINLTTYRSFVYIDIGPDRVVNTASVPTPLILSFFKYDFERGVCDKGQWFKAGLGFLKIWFN